MSRARIFVAGAAGALLAITAPATAQEAADVDVVDVAFEPEEVTVDAGGTVTWTQTGSLPHTVTADDGSFDSHPDCTGSGGACMGTGDTFAETFDEEGEYAYYCRIHGGPGGVGMSGVVVVTAAGTAAPTDEPTTDAPTEDEGDPTAVTGDISVADQSGDGTSVTVDSVTIEGADGFVVIHLDEDGGPGPVIGHVAVSEGTSTDLQVPLDEALTSDATVWPMLHVDAGTLGTYEFPGADTPVTVDGAVVMAPLAFSLSAPDATTEDPAAEDELPRTGVPLGGAVLAAGLAVASGALILRRTRGGHASTLG